MEPIELPWGREGTLPLNIPPTWRVVARGDVTPPEPILDLALSIRDGLDDPIGSPPLHALVGGRTRIALVMDDAGRPTPVHRLAEIAIFPQGGASFPVIAPGPAEGNHGA